ncbi:MAG: riboflavin kinase, partial [Acidobacteriota bacterium]
GLGVPTANLQVINEMLPPDGVYVTEAVLGKDTLPGVTNIGNRPTFEGTGHTVETHLLDFDRKISGEAIRVRFLARLREERRFSSSDALREQIDSDLREARRFFEKN